MSFGLDGPAEPRHSQAVPAVHLHDHWVSMLSHSQDSGSKSFTKWGLVGGVCIGALRPLPHTDLIPTCPQQSWSPSPQSLMQPPAQRVPSQAGGKQGQKCRWVRGKQVDGQGPCYLLGGGASHRWS